MMVSDVLYNCSLETLMGYLGNIPRGRTTNVMVDVDMAGCCVMAVLLCVSFLMSSGVSELGAVCAGRGMSLIGSTTSTICSKGRIESSVQ